MRPRTHVHVMTGFGASSTLPFPAGAYRALLGD